MDQSISRARLPRGLHLQLSNDGLNEKQQVYLLHIEGLNGAGPLTEWPCCNAGKRTVAVLGVRAG